MGTTAGSAASYWRGHVEAWRSSGQSRGEYCAALGLSRKTFGWWVWHLERAERQGLEALRFLPVEVAEAPGAEPDAAEPVPGDERIEIALIEIALPDGLLVRVGTGFDATALRRVLAVLGR